VIFKKLKELLFGSDKEHNIGSQPLVVIPDQLLELRDYVTHLKVITGAQYVPRLGQNHKLYCHHFDIKELVSVVRDINKQLEKGLYRNFIELSKPTNYTVDDLFIDKKTRSYISQDSIDDLIKELDSFCQRMCSFDTYEYGAGEHNFRTLSGLIDTLNKICSGLIMTRI